MASSSMQVRLTNLFLAVISVLRLLTREVSFLVEGGCMEVSMMPAAGMGVHFFLRVRGFLSEIGGMDSMLLGYGSAAGRTEFFLGCA